MYKYLVGLVLVMAFMVGNVFAGEFKVGKPFVQLGHSESVLSVAISPNGKYALSGSDDKTLKLWDIKTGKEIRTFKGHIDGVYSVAISPDGKYALSGSLGGTLKLWDIQTGKEIRTIKGHDEVFGCVNSVVISPDGKYALSGSSDKTLKLWNIQTGKEIRTFKGHIDGVNSVAISPDAKFILSGSSDKTLKLWDIQTGKEIRTFKGHTKTVNSVVISPDAKFILSGSSDKTLKLWDIKTGKEIRIFKGHTHWVNSVTISPDAKFVLSGSNDKTLKLWDIKTGKEIRTFKGDAGDGYSVVISSDGKKALSGGGGFNKTLKLWDIKTGKEIRTFKGHISNISSVTITPDAKYTLSRSWDKTLKLWNIKTGEEIQIIKGESNISSSVNTLSITKDDKYALFGNYDKTLGDIYKDETIKTFMKDLYKVSSVAITQNKKFALSWNSKLFSFERNMKQWDIKTAKNIRNYKGSVNNVLAVGTTSEGKQVFLGDNDKTLELWNIDTGKKISSFRGHNSYINSAFIPLNGKYALSGSDDKTLKLWDIKTGKEIRTFKGHTGRVSSVVITKDLKYVLSGSWDGTIRYWNLKTGKEVLKTISFTDGEWLSITPEGYFNASKNGAKHLNILTGPMEVSSIDQYYETFYRPDIVASVMGDSKTKFALPKPTLKLSDVKPAPQVAIIDTKESINKEELKVTLKITPSSGGIGQIRLYLDGVLIKTDGDRGLQKKQAKNVVLKTYTIKLPKGKHTIKAIVYNEANTMASREDILAVVSTYNPIVKPNIYAVVVGINEYKNPAIALKYAVADAKLFAKTIKKRTKGLYGNVKVELLISKEQTSKDNITKTLKEMEDISPNDLFIFFVASHGMIEDAKYHMITSNVGALSSRGIKKEAISQEALRDMIANIPTTKKFIILDTCNSGALGQALEVALLTRGLTETTAMKVLSRAVGSTIISASSSSQEALEGYKGHGLLTYVLSQGLNGKADMDGDGYIKTLEIANFVEDTVPEIAEKEFNRDQYPYVSPLGQGFPLVKVK